MIENRNDQLRGKVLQEVVQNVNDEFWFVRWERLLLECIEGRAVHGGQKFVGSRCNLILVEDDA